MTPKLMNSTNSKNPRPMFPKQQRTKKRCFPPSLVLALHPSQKDTILHVRESSIFYVSDSSFEKIIIVSFCKRKKWHLLFGSGAHEKCMPRVITALEVAFDKYGWYDLGCSLFFRNILILFRAFLPGRVFPFHYIFFPFVLPSFDVLSISRYSVWGNRKGNLMHSKMGYF